MCYLKSFNYIVSNQYTSRTNALKYSEGNQINNSVSTNRILNEFVTYCNSERLVLFIVFQEAFLGKIACTRRINKKKLLNACFQVNLLFFFFRKLSWTELLKYKKNGPNKRAFKSLFLGWFFSIVFQKLPSSKIAYKNNGLNKRAF